MNLDTIDTIIIVMLENRSFDHLLGYLSLPPFNRTDVDGLKISDSAKYLNHYNGTDYSVFRLENPDRKLQDDPPHERYNIGIQLGKGPPYEMNGFVSSYSDVANIDPSDKPMVMGYYGADELPTTHFLAPVEVKVPPSRDELRRLADEAGAVWIVKRGEIVDRKNRKERAE